MTPPETANDSSENPIKENTTSKEDEVVFVPLTPTEIAPIVGLGPTPVGSQGALRPARTGNDDDDCRDIDGDNVCDDDEDCPKDPDKTKPGVCGCGNEDVDSDQDTYFSCAGCAQGQKCGDCDDQNPNIFPGAPEFCGGADVNCDNVDSALCTFTTSTTHDGNLTNDDQSYPQWDPAAFQECVDLLQASDPTLTSGIVYGDCICNELAKTSDKAQIRALGEDRKFRAWLSAPGDDSLGNPLVNAVDHVGINGEYANPLGEIVLPGDNFLSNLFNLAHLLLPLDKDESGEPVASNVWTGTLPNGKYVGATANRNRLHDCVSWSSTSPVPNTFQTVGTTDKITNEWTASALGLILCTEKKPIYCFQKPETQ